MNEKDQVSVMLYFCGSQVNVKQQEKLRRKSMFACFFFLFPNFKNEKLCVKQSLILTFLQIFYRKGKQNLIT